MEQEIKSKKVRGTAEIFADNRITFRPQGEGSPTQLDKRKVGKSSLYKTTSEKEPQIVAHLSVAASNPDPVGQLHDDLSELTKDMPRKRMEQPRGKLLIDVNGLRIFANSTRHSITVVQEIDCNEHKNYERFMLNQMQEIFKCFTINQASLAKLSSARKNCSCNS